MCAAVRRAPTTQRACASATTAPRSMPLVFSGGSSYGLEAAAGVATALKDDGARSGNSSDIAGVNGAIIYDFGGHRLNEIYPDKRLGQAALHAARSGV